MERLGGGSEFLAPVVHGVHRLPVGVGADQVVGAHEDPRHRVIDSVFGEGQVTGDVHGGMDDVSPGVDEEHQVSRDAGLGDLVVVFHDGTGGLVGVAVAGVGLRVEKVECGPVAVWLAIVGIGGGRGEGVKAFPGEGREEIQETDMAPVGKALFGFEEGAQIADADAGDGGAPVADEFIDIGGGLDQEAGQDGVLSGETLKEVEALFLGLDAGEDELGVAEECVAVALVEELFHEADGFRGGPLIADKQAVGVALGNEEGRGVVAIGGDAGEVLVEAGACLGREREDQFRRRGNGGALFVGGHGGGLKSGIRLGITEARLDENGADFLRRNIPEVPLGKFFGGLLEGRVFLRLFDADIVGEEVAPGA